MTSVLVTGAVGNVGREVVRALLARDVDVIAAYHKQGRVAALSGDAVKDVPLDFRDPPTWAAALGGTEQ